MGSDFFVLPHYCFQGEHSLAGIGDQNPFRLPEALLSKMIVSSGAKLRLLLSKLLK